MAAPTLDGLKTVLVDALRAQAHPDDFSAITIIDEDGSRSTNFSSYAVFSADKLAQTIHDKVAAPLLERIAELEADRSVTLTIDASKVRELVDERLAELESKPNSSRPAHFTELQNALLVNAVTVHLILHRHMTFEEFFELSSAVDRLEGDR